MLRLIWDKNIRNSQSNKTQIPVSTETQSIRFRNHMRAFPFAACLEKRQKKLDCRGGMGPRGISDTNLNIGQVLVMKEVQHSQVSHAFKALGLAHATLIKMWKVIIIFDIHHTECNVTI